LRVDKQKTPGSYFLTGSTEFSEKMGIRETLTGRIGLLQLFPLNFAESHELSSPTWKKIIHSQTLRVPAEKLILHALRGGMPSPMFLRDSKQIEQYWSGWFETTLYRDLRRVYGKGYNPDIALKIFRSFGEIYQNGELATLAHFKQDSRTLRRYLGAMEILFLVRKISPHWKAIGSEHWLLFDSGFLNFLMKKQTGEGPSLSLVRHSIWNELLSNHEYRLGPYRPEYYKSAKGSPIDWIDEEASCAFKIILQGRTQSFAYEERALHGAMKTLDLKFGFLIAPISDPEIPQRGGIGILPWTYWT
jgi:uncharacterized protein